MTKILVVDDSAFMRTTVRKILADVFGDGVNIIGEAANGDDAIEKYKTLKPDIVLLDVVMPISGGIDALKGIMNIDPNAKVIMLTALNQRNIVVDAIKFGAKDYLTKPVKSERLKEVLKRYM